MENLHRPIKGLSALSDLSKEEREKFYAEHKAELARYENSPMNYSKRAAVLYNNQRFIDTFGKDKFDALDVGTEEAYNFRNKLLKEKLVRDAFDEYFSPYDEEGNVVKGKGMGLGLWEKYRNMTSDGMLELMNSDWNTPTEMAEENEKRLEETKKIIAERWEYKRNAPTISSGGMHPGIDPAVNEIAGAIEAGKTDSKYNDALAEKIYAKDLKKRTNELSSKVQEVKEAKYDSMEDKEVDKNFETLINPDKEKGTRGLYWATYYNNGGDTVEEEMENFTVEDKKRILAEADVYSQNLSYIDAYNALDHEARNYIADHQDGWTRAGLFAKDVGISVASYTADKFNSVRMAYLAVLDGTDDGVLVYRTMDGNGTVVPTSTVVKRGDKYYSNDVEVMPVKMNRTTLDWMGKDSEGNTRDAFWNQQFWSDAEQFGTLDWEEQARAKELGASKYNVAYHVGDDSHILYESMKMVSFALADIGAMCIPMGGAALGGAMSATKMAGMTGKILSTTGKIITATSRITQALQPADAALAIGNAYGRGLNGEASAQNLATLDERVRDSVIQQFQKDLEDNPELKSTLEKEINDRAAAIKKQLLESRDDDGTSYIDSSALDDYAKQIAIQQVRGEMIDSRIKEYKRSADYVNAVNEAFESAGDAALAASFTTAIKYGFVNYFGYRNYLFKTSLQRAEEAAAKAAEKMSFQGGRVVVEDTYKTFGQKAKHFGRAALSQGWGGAWTNGTDELQSEGARAINEGRYEAYLNGMYDADASATTYGILDGVNSYMIGFARGLAKEQTYNAALVGGLGSGMSCAPNATAFMSGNFRTQWRNAQSFGEKANIILSNGLMAEYYAGKQAERNLRRHAEYINNIVDQNGDFQVIQDAIALNLASMDATSDADKITLEYLRAIAAAELLNRFQVEEESPTSWVGKFKRNIKKFLDTNTSEEESLEKAAQVAAVSKHSVMQDAMSMIEKLTNADRMSEEELGELLEEYYAKNPNIVRTEETDAKALEQLQNNAQKLRQGLETWKKAEEILTEAERKRGENIPPNIRYELKKKFALEEHWKEALGEAESAVTGSSEVSETTALESYGNRPARDAMLKVIERDRTTLEERHREALDKVEEAKKALEEEEHLYDDETGTVGEEELRAYIESIQKKQLALDNAQLRAEYLKSRIEKLTTLQDEISSISGEDSRVLSAEEILHLAPEDRARMLNPKNLKNYGKKQRKVINELLSELKIKDPSILDKINAASVISSRIKANREAYEKMLDNPQAALMEFEAQRDTVDDVTYQIPIQRSIENIDNALQKLETTPGVDDTLLKDLVYKNLRTLNPAVLKYYKKSELPSATKYATEIDNALSWGKFTSDIDKVIKSQDWSEEQKKSLSSSVVNIIERTNNKEEALKALEKVLDSAEVADEVKADVETLLKGLEELDYQRDATTLQDRKARQERETQLRKEREKAEAEKKASEAELDESSLQDVKLDDEGNTKEKGKEGETEGKDSEEKGKEAPVEPEGETGQTPTADTLIDSTLENVDLGEISEVKTPSIDAQVEGLSNTDNDKVEVQDTTKIDAVETANRTNTVDPNIMQSNPYYRYVISELKNFGKLVLREGQQANDAMNQYFKWMADNGVQLQEIIDNELGRIKALNPAVHYIFVKPQSNSLNDMAMQRHLVQVVEYTPEIAKIHDTNRGGVLRANGKSWLVIGTQWWSGTAQMQMFNDMAQEMRKSRKQYFDDNPTERFYVNEKYKTKIADMTPGRIVRQLLTDDAPQIRSITDLLADPVRNPRGLKLEDLKWGIQKGGKFATVNVSSRNRVYPPTDAEGNNGALFLMIEAANGGYLPAKIIPTMLSELKDGELKTNINNLIMQLMSPKHADRLKAIKELVQKLVLDENNNILIGTASKNTVSVKKNGVVIKSFNLDDAGFNSQEFLAAVSQLNPRIQIGLGDLTNQVTLQQLAEAGCLNTDIAKLGTSNANHSVFACDSNGEPIISTPTVPNSGTSSDYTRKQGHSVLYLGQVYRERNGQFYDAVDRVITDPRLITQLSYNQRIESSNMQPVTVKGNYEYYIMSTDKKNPVAVKRDVNTHQIILESKDASLKLIKQVAEEQAEKAREEAAKRAEAALESGKFEITGTENVDIGVGETLTPEQIAQQTMGDFGAVTVSPVGENQKDSTKAPEEPTEKKPTNADNGINGSARPLSGQLGEKTSYSYQEIQMSSEFGNRLDSIIEAKMESGEWADFPDDNAEAEQWFRDRNITTVGITNVEEWLDMLENCKS